MLSLLDQNDNTTAVISVVIETKSMRCNGVAMGCTYSENSNGPSTEPCGTPDAGHVLYLMTHHE